MKEYREKLDITIGTKQTKQWLQSLTPHGRQTNLVSASELLAAQHTVINTLQKGTTFSQLRDDVRCFALQSWVSGRKSEGQLHLKMTYKPFEDDESDTAGYQEAEAYALLLQEQAITDIKSAAGNPPHRPQRIFRLDVQETFAYMFYLWNCDRILCKSALQATFDNPS